MRQFSLSVNQQPALTLSSQQTLPGRHGVTPSASGSLTEIIISEAGAIQPLHLLPLLAECNRQQRWLMWLSPERPMNKQWLTSMNMQEVPVLHVELCNLRQLELCKKVLGSGNSHVIIEWQGRINNSERQQIRQAALSSNSHVVLVRQDPGFDA
ncbi:cell division inhibitor SulA [Parathalassolituus penaei]|uniref:SulA-like leucine-rich domain-containing protein n=1 Tax=Parathalassolituus penaei TaxID=2997323 RepID=A0A9X3IRW4_9GAMM|nr:SulA-like leucine-rich domain-containing protein [Parathalassolituus penaei]MCY0964655.1 SulA-like leucine-rich domain-containing protein [Parathalassolituus penaei]